MCVLSKCTYNPEHFCEKNCLYLDKTQVKLFPYFTKILFDCLLISWVIYKITLTRYVAYVALH